MSRRNADLLNGRMQEGLRTRPFVLSGPSIIIPSNASCRWANNAVKLPCLTADKLLEALRILRRNDNLTLLSLFAGGSVSCAQGEGAAAFGPRHMGALCELLKDSDLRMLDLGMVGDDFMFHNLKWEHFIQSLEKVTRLAMCPSVYRRLTRQEKATIQKKIDRAVKNPIEPVDEEIDSLIDNCIKDCNINPQFVPVRNDCLMRCSKCRKWRCTSLSVYERFQMKVFLCSHMHRSCDDTEDVKVDSWVQCMQCQKWRRVPRVIKIKFEMNKTKFQCVDLARTNQSCDEPEEKLDQGLLSEQDRGKRKLEDMLIIPDWSSRGLRRSRYHLNDGDRGHSQTLEPHLHHEPRQEEALMLTSRSSRFDKYASAFGRQTPATRSTRSDRLPSPRSSRHLTFFDQVDNGLNARKNYPVSSIQEVELRRRTDALPSNCDSDPDCEPLASSRRTRNVNVTPKARPKTKASAKKRGWPKGVPRSSRLDAAALAASAGGVLTFAPPRMSEAEYAAFTAADGGFIGESGVASVTAASAAIPQQQLEQPSTGNNGSKPEAEITHSLDTGAPQTAQIRASRDDGTLVVELSNTVAYGPCSTSTSSSVPRAHPYGIAETNTAAPLSFTEKNAATPSTPSRKTVDALSRATSEIIDASSTSAQKETRTPAISLHETPVLQQRYAAASASTHATVPLSASTSLSTSPGQVSWVVVTPSRPDQAARDSLPLSLPPNPHVPINTSLQLSPASVKCPNAATRPTLAHTIPIPKVSTPPALLVDAKSQVATPVIGRTLQLVANQATQGAASVPLLRGREPVTTLMPAGIASSKLNSTRSSVALATSNPNGLAPRKRGRKPKVAAIAMTATAVTPPAPTRAAEGVVASSVVSESEVPPATHLEGTGQPLTEGSMADSWVQCDACNKWWRCSESFMKKYESCFFDCECAGGKCVLMVMKRRKKR